MEYIRSVYPEWKKELEAYQKKRSSKRYVQNNQLLRDNENNTGYGKSIGNLPIVNEVDSERSSSKNKKKENK